MQASESMSTRLRSLQACARLQLLCGWRAVAPFNRAKALLSVCSPPSILSAPCSRQRVRNPFCEPLLRYRATPRTGELSLKKMERKEQPPDLTKMDFFWFVRNPAASRDWPPAAFARTVDFAQPSPPWIMDEIDAARRLRLASATTSTISPRSKIVFSAPAEPGSFFYRLWIGRLSKAGKFQAFRSKPF